MSEEKTETPNKPVGRPKTVVSRRKGQEAAKCLKQAIKNERLSFAVRLRAVELYFVLLGLELPDSSRRNTKAVKTLVEERQGERSFHAQIREQVAEKVRLEAEAEAREAQAQREADADAMLKSFLKPSPEPTQTPQDV